MEGWISLHRRIMENSIWNDKPFSKGQAWIDLLLMANHKDHKFLHGNSFIEVKRGSFITSEVKLSDRWGWSRKKTRGFLQVLEKDQMISKKSTTRYTTITVEKYEVYQGQGTSKDTTKGQPRAHQGNTNNKDNNVNNDNNYNKDYNSSSSSKTERIQKAIEYTLGRSPKSYEVNELAKYDLEIELIEKALDETIRNNVQTIKYTKTILDRCIKEGITTIEEYNRDQMMKKPTSYDGIRDNKPIIRSECELVQFERAKQRRMECEEDEALDF